MKKVICSLLTTLLVFSSLCAASKKSLSLEPIEFDLPSEKCQEFNYAIDPRIEVIGTICRLAGYENFNHNYTSDNLLTQNDLIFEKYKDHKAVQAIKNYRSQKNIGGDAWINLAYFIKPDFSGTILDFKPYPADLNPELKKLTATQLNNLVKAIHDFAADTNYPRICTINRGSYMSDFGWMKEDLEKAMINTWGKEFFNMKEVPEVNVTVSRYVCGGDYYDFANDANENKVFYLTIFPGTYYSDIVLAYSMIFCQFYANNSWDKVKDNYIKYIKDFSKKLNPDNAKAIDKEELYSNSLSSSVASFCMLPYFKYRGEHQTEEDIEKYGDYSQTAETYEQAMEKTLGDVAVNAFKLFDKYVSDKTAYPDFTCIYSELDDFINSLKIEQ